MGSKKKAPDTVRILIGSARPGVFGAFSAPFRSLKTSLLILCKLGPAALSFFLLFSASPPPRTGVSPPIL